MYGREEEGDSGTGRRWKGKKKMIREQEGDGKGWLLHYDDKQNIAHYPCKSSTPQSNRNSNLHSKKTKKRKEVHKK